MQTDDPELDQLKTWWQRSGRPILWGLIVAAALFLAWQSWQRIKNNRQEQASALYGLLLSAASMPDEQLNLAQVASLGEQLNKNYGSTGYSQYGRLVMAKLAVHQGKLDDAVSELRAVVDNPAGADVQELARQRLARVLASQGKLDEALGLLAGEPSKAYLSAREELRGDLLVRLKRKDEALAAYRKAKAALAKDADGEILQLKLDDLGQGDA